LSTISAGFEPERIGTGARLVSVPNSFEGECSDLVSCPQTYPPPRCHDRGHELLIRRDLMLRFSQTTCKTRSISAPRTLFFCKPDGSSYHPDVLRKDVLYPALDRLGIPRVCRMCGFHALRHSAGSIVNAVRERRKRGLKYYTAGQNERIDFSAFVWVAGLSLQVGQGAGVFPSSDSGIRCRLYSREKVPGTGRRKNL